jgi:hypothetical protein
MAKAADQVEQYSDSRKAVKELSELRMDQASDQGAFHSRPINGKAKKAKPRMAKIRTGTGRRSRPTRRCRTEGRAGAESVTAS